ncbi:hypothetical protein EVAR_80896_1 [Eumeta japonica]|uniref:Uncharacterized protein n=1 Tax=Eumeta variegata TaxID=151549 RepID=A0A4C1V0V4_EUMVA|nr:hypothetical protein EVAR_80896_1 [Eumeta japonica]
MEIEQVKVKSTNYSDSSIISKKVTAAKIVASNKEATVSGVNIHKTTNVAGSKPSSPPKMKFAPPPPFPNGIPFHTSALEEERKVKAVIKGVPVEIETEDIKRIWNGRSIQSKRCTESTVETEPP